MEVDIFIPCFIDQLYPQTGLNFAALLEKAGAVPFYNAEQTCCGQPAFNMGYRAEASKLAEKFVSDFSSGRPVVTPGASCAGYIRSNYEQLLAGKPDKAAGAASLSANIFEFTDFLVNKLGYADFGGRLDAKVTFHDSCSALREYGIKQEPRELLRNIRGIELIEMDEVETCCGFGGSFAVKHPDISQAMAQQKTEWAMATGAEYIVATESSCLMNISGYIAKNKLPIKIIHIVDLIALSLK
jgi:L-lactate dehydrogenase complex protein LldE